MNPFSRDNRDSIVEQARETIRLAFFAACAAVLAGSFAVTQAQDAPAGNAKNGKQLYSDKTCEQCHGANGEGDSGPKIAPPPAYADYIMQLRNPVDRMPAFSTAALSDAEAGDIYAFLKSLGTPAAANPDNTAPRATVASIGRVVETVSFTKTAAAKPQTAQTAQTAPSAPGNAQNGGRMFVAYGCYECHGRVAQGGSTGPRLGPHPIALTGVIHELRHPNEMPPYSEKVISDAEIADIYAFLQSLPEPPKPDSIALLSK